MGRVRRCGGARVRFHRAFDRRRIAADIGLLGPAGPRALYDRGFPARICPGNGLKALTAWEDGCGAAPAAAGGERACAAVTRYLHTPMKRHHGLRIAEQALDFVAREG